MRLNKLKNTKKNLVEAHSIVFEQDDLDAFSSISGDTNPLHMDPDYARVSPYGQNVVFGVLGLLACLGKVTGQPGEILSRLEAQFVNPIFLGVEYYMEVSRQENGHIRIDLCDKAKRYIVLKAFTRKRSMAEGQVSGKKTETGQGRSEFMPLPAPLSRTDQEFQTELSVEGAYSMVSTSSGLLRKLITKDSGVTPLHIETLMLCSYLIGMLLPGKRALFSKLTLDFHELEQRKSAGLDFSARSEKMDTAFNRLTIGLTCSSQGQVFAQGTLVSFVRREIAPVTIAALGNIPADNIQYYSGKVALVIGGSRGLGAAFVQTLAMQGCTVICNYHRSDAEAGNLREMFKDAPGKVVLFKGDAADINVCKELHEMISRTFGRLDILVCSASRPPLAIDDSLNNAEIVSEYLKTNIELVNAPFSTFLGMLSKSNGVSVVISSIVVEEGSKEFPLYLKSKMAIEYLVRSTSKTFPSVGVVFVRPSRLMTDMTNTPLGFLNTIPPEAVSVSVVNALPGMETRGEPVVLNRFGKKDDERQGSEHAIPEVKENSRSRTISQEGPRDKVTGDEPVLALSGKKSIVVSASFVAEPILPSLRRWTETLNMPFKVTFAPYNQIYQELLNPESLTRANEGGINIIALCVEDWLRYVEEGQDPYGVVAKTALTIENAERLDDYADEFVDAVERFAALRKSFTLVLICPSSPEAYDLSENTSSIFAECEDKMVEKIGKLSGIGVIKAAHYHKTYRISTYWDAVSNSLGHIPYTSQYFGFLGTICIRRIWSFLSKPVKVLVVDCDNTLWGGVCGERSPEELEIEGRFLKLQQLLIDQSASGRLVCLCSKNAEDDVWKVFDTDPRMVLQRKHIVDRRINWDPKSQNIKSLAQGLGLGIDSFVFIDDNPVECAEVRSNCPEVLTVQWPDSDAEAEKLLEHLWVLDSYSATEEDRLRAESYKSNVSKKKITE